MPLSAAEKMKRYRERQKEKGLKEEMLIKDRNRKKVARKAMTPKQLKFLQEKEKIAQRKCREKKRDKTVNHSEMAVSHASSSNQYSPYKSPNTLRKAVKRVNSFLPISPRKRFKVLTELTKDHCVATVQSTVQCELQRLSPGTEENVIKFYTRDDISWQAPGSKDYTIIKNEHGKKSQVQKRFMVTSLKEAHALFVEEFPQHMVKLSKFCSLRPPHVFTFRDTPHQVCLCKYHENIRLLLKALQSHIPDLPINYREFISSVVCNQNSEKCMFSECQDCKFTSLKVLYGLVEEQLQNAVKWEQWEMVNQRVALQAAQGSLGQCLDILQRQLPDFFIHTFIKRQQSLFFENKKKQASENHVVVQVDFAENYTVSYQCEIQSAHWAKSQITIFTVFVWNCDSKGYSCAFISDNTEHDKYAVHAFLDKLVKHMLSVNPDIQSVTFMSDGAASQFKQRFLFANLSFFKDIYNIDVSWNFFATSHGKGVVDGIGGTIKRSVWHVCKASNASVQNAQEFSELAKEKCPSIKIFFVPATDIDANKEQLDLRWKDLSAVPNTKAIHCIRPVAPYVVECKRYSYSSAHSRHNFHRDEVNAPNQPMNIEISTEPENPLPVLQGEFALVSFPGKKSVKYYVGQVTDKDSDNYEMSFLRKTDETGLVFSFPSKEDKCWIEKFQIKKSNVDNRNRYHFTTALSKAE